MINNKRRISHCFSFGPLTYDDILKKNKKKTKTKTNSLDTAKASQQSNIPTKILK